MGTKIQSFTEKIMFNTIPRLIHNTYYLLLFILLTTFYLILPTPVHAATVTWDGGASGSWNTSTNWSNDIVPTSSDDVTIDNEVLKTG